VGVGGMSGTSDMGRDFNGDAGERY
jgi:hypothetical protein